ncbi:MAG: DUF1854 domain-containing protein [Armatimonadetes bacterium]|nr:DUF1854 domain-containing protein [Armatimonadota bacterium]
MTIDNGGPSNGSSRGSTAGFEVRVLDARDLQVTRDAFDHLCLTIGGEETHDKVKVARAFPLSEPDRFISFLTHEGREIGMLRELKGMDGSSRRIVEEELDLLYFTPVIQKIHAVESKHGATTWQLLTNRGEKTVYVKDRGEIRRLPGRRIMFTDVHGLKYDLPDYTKLDERSRSLLESEI